MENKICMKVIEIMELFSKCEYKTLEQISRGIRFNAIQIKEEIDDYGEEIIPYPPNKLDLIDIIKVVNVVPRKWSVVAPFWTTSEGESELSLEITAIQNGDNIDVEIDNMHVM